ncbi:MAG: hypothetical protein ABL860_09585 [Candidatus Nitrotoga sp.]
MTSADQNSVRRRMRGLGWPTQQRCHGLVDKVAANRRGAAAVMFCEQPIRGLPAYPASIWQAYRLIRLKP